jgi:hypothetical protein
VPKSSSNCPWRRKKHNYNTPAFLKSKKLANPDLITNLAHQSGEIATPSGYFRCYAPTLGHIGLF